MNDKSLSEQYDLLSNKGKYIGVRQYYNYFINLYLLDDEFYEVWYFRKEIRIEKIEKLTDDKKLNLYIDFELKSNKSTTHSNNVKINKEFK